MSEELKFTDKDNNNFVTFIAKKSKDVTVPLDFEDLCSEFKRESGTSHSEDELIIRLRLIRLRIHRLKDFDNDTKVKMLFGLSAPVDYGFLDELKKEADIEVDEYNRITKYEKKEEGGLQLSGIHSLSRFPDDTVRNMLYFLAEISLTRNTSMTDDDFLKEFAELWNSTHFKSCLEERYNFYKYYLHMATGYDIPTRIKILFVSDTRVDRFFLEMIRKDAIVDVDDEGKITKYEAHDGSLTLGESQNESDGSERSETNKSNESKEAGENDESYESDVEQQDERSEERVRINGINTQTAVVNPTMPVKIEEIEETEGTEVSDKSYESDVEQQNQNKKPFFCFSNPSSFSFSETQVHSEINEVKKETNSDDLSEERVRINGIDTDVLNPTMPVKMEETEESDESDVEQQDEKEKPFDTQVDFDVKKEMESISDDLADEQVKNDGINAQTAVAKPTTPVKKQGTEESDETEETDESDESYELERTDETEESDVEQQDDVEVNTNSSVTRSGRVSKKIYPTADFFANHGDDQFFRNRRRRSRLQHLKSKQSNAVVDDDSPTTSSNDAMIGGNKNNTSSTLSPKIPVPISDSRSSSINDDLEFNAPTNEDNEEAAKTSESTKISKNRNGADAKKAAKSAESTSKIGKIPAISKTENEVKSNIKKVSEPIKTTATPKINDSKGNKTVQKKKNINKTASKTENKKRKLVSSTSGSTAAKIAKKSEKSASEDPSKQNQQNEESQEDDLIYEGGDPPLPIPLLPHKTEEIMDYQEQIDNFIEYQNAPMEFGNSQLLPDYQHDVDVKLEEMDHLEAIRDASFAPVNSSFPTENGETQGIGMASSEDILKVLRSLVRSLDAPMVMLRETSKKNLQEFLKKIDDAMEKMRVEEHNVASDEMMTILNASLQNVTKSTPSTTSSEDSMSLQLFLCFLRSILITLSIPALDDFQETVNENLRELAGQDKIISIERIRRSLEIVLTLAVS